MGLGYVRSITGDDVVVDFLEPSLPDMTITAKRSSCKKPYATRHGNIKEDIPFAKVWYFRGVNHLSSLIPWDETAFEEILPFLPEEDTDE